jgi:hypothetical protein
MTRKNAAAAAASPKPAGAPAKQKHGNPATIEEFDREHMGIAAKE